MFSHWEGRAADQFQFPDSVKIRIPSDEERACHSYANEVCFHKADFNNGLHFPINPFVRDLFSYLHLAPEQLVPNSWWILVSCMVVWMSANDGDVISRDEFPTFIVWENPRTPAIMSLSRGIWLLRDVWEMFKAPKFFCSWGVPVSGASFSSFWLLSSFFISDNDRWLIGALVL